MTIEEFIERQADDYALKATPSDVHGNFDKHSIAQAFEDGAKWIISQVGEKLIDYVNSQSIEV